MSDFPKQLDLSKPVIWTSKGNLQLDALEYRHYREDVPGAIVFIEEYMLGAESVKRSVHVLPVVGICREGDFTVSVTGETGKLPG